MNLGEKMNRKEYIDRKIEQLEDCFLWREGAYDAEKLETIVTEFIDEIQTKDFNWGEPTPEEIKEGKKWNKIRIKQEAKREKELFKELKKEYPALKKKLLAEIHLLKL